MRLQVSDQALANELLRLLRRALRRRARRREPSSDLDPGDAAGAEAAARGVAVATAKARTGKREAEHLRVLVVNEQKKALVESRIAALGHHVIALEIEIGDVEAAIASERPDVAFVGLGESSEHALGLIEKIVQEDSCPAIVLLHEPDPGFVKEASRRGVFAYLEAELEDWQSGIDIALRRFADHRDLTAAFARRAVIERAKGILMERHSIGEESAFALLRDHARNSNRRLVEVAAAVVDGYLLLPKEPHPPP